MLCFVYGTLTDPEVAGRVLDSFVYRGRATLVGCHRADGSYPTLVPGGEVTGRLLETDEVATLDRYEGVADGLYVRVSIPFESPDTSPATVETYVGDPDRLDAPAEWPGDGPFERRVAAYVRESDVRVRRD